MGGIVLKLECDVVRDLLPLYIEGLTKEGSNEFLVKHIKDCRECKEVLDGLQKEIIDENANKAFEIKDKPSKKLVKRIRNRIIAFVVIALVMGVCLNTVGSYAFKIYQTRTVAADFLYNVSKGDFNQAFDYVAYFDFASDIEPKISYEDAKKAWVGRISELKSKDIYVKSYSGLRVWTDDTYPNGEVTLTVVESGVERKYRAKIHFAPYSKEWKIQNIYSWNDGNQSELEKALYGYIVTNK